MWNDAVVLFCKYQAYFRYCLLNRLLSILIFCRMYCKFYWNDATNMFSNMKFLQKEEMNENKNALYL